MRVLIIGYGYIGAPLAAQLSSLGHEVVAIRRQAVQAPAGIAVHAIDITKREDLGRLAPDFDWVVNCVSSGHGGAEQYRAVYLEGTRNVIHWLGVSERLNKYVYTSSTGVYSQDDGSLVDERAETVPITETARVLLQAEEVVLQAHRQAGFPGTILRLAGIYGPERSYWVRRVLDTTAVIEGTGERLLNMIHRDDAAGAIVAALEHGTPGEIYNVVDDEPVPQRIFLEWLCQRLGRPAPPTGTPTEARKRGITNKRVSNRKLKADLRYVFQHPSFREGYQDLCR